MKHIFFLSGEHIELGTEEILSLLDAKKHRSDGRIIIAETKNKHFNRLALTKKVYKFLFECKQNELAKKVSGYGWDSVYKKNFSVRKFDVVGKSKISEKELADLVWRSLAYPKADLRNAKTKIGFLFAGSKAYCGILDYENDEDFESRKGHQRPFYQPGCLHPKLARALVNITGIKENQTLLDPFAGTGGILIEAGLMNVRSIGYDIGDFVLKGCKKNLIHFRIKNSMLYSQNAMDIEHKFDFLATDLPYGKSSKTFAINNKKEPELELFYIKFLNNIKKLKRKAVVVFPNFVNYKKILKSANLKAEFKCSIYIHKNLSRNIIRVS